jgi:O-antigen/teichoic acid export membrane protein
VYLKGDIVLMQWFVPQTEIGVYGAAYRVLDVITQSGMMMMGLLLPLLTYAWSRRETGLFHTRYQQSFDLLMLFAIPCTTAGIILARPIMTIVAGDQFIASGRILAILCLAIMGVYIGAIFGHLAVAINRQKETIWVYLSSAVLTLIGYLFFIPRYGMYGAAWMSVFSELFVGACLWLTIRRFVPDALHFKTVGKILLATGLMSLGLWLTAPINIFIRIICGIVIYGSVLIATGGITQQTIREIFSSSKSAS